MHLVGTKSLIRIPTNGLLQSFPRNPVPVKPFPRVHTGQMSIREFKLAIHKNVFHAPAKVVKTGFCAAPARRPMGYVRILPDGPIHIKGLENHWAQIVAAAPKMVGLAPPLGRMEQR